MYRAVYDFNSTQANILNFQNGDIFLDRGDYKSDESKCEGWIWVLDKNMDWGFIPATYAISINILEEPSAGAFVKELIERAKCEIDKESPNSEFKEECQQLYEELLRYDQQINAQTDAPNVDENCDEEANLQIENVPVNNVCKLNCESGNDSEGSGTKSTSRESSPHKNHNTSDVNWELEENFGLQIVEHIKLEASLTHRQAKKTVEAFITFVQHRVPAAASLMEAIHYNLISHVPTVEDIEGTRDWHRLASTLGAISDIKDDVEQLNWALHEDLHIILEFLEELIVILTEGDPLVVKTFLQKNQYRDVEAIVQYYQMETRQSIRQVLLKVIAALCNIERIVINILAVSDMPLLLSKEIQENTEDFQKMCYICNVLTMLMWPGEPLPVTHHDVLNANFFGFILGMVENPPEENDTEKIQDSCIQLLLAFNLQFQESDANTVLSVLTTRQSAPEFSRKLIVLANREDDPVRNMFTHQPTPPNSMHKMLSDIFSRSDTADLFYTSDLKVLIEIVVRKLKDLPAGDEGCSFYLRLSRSIIRCTNYADHAHCQHELQDCFQTILKEDALNPEEDKTIVDDIFQSFPTIFHA